MTEAMVAVLLCVYAANLHQVNPSISEVARVSGVSSRSIYRTVTEQAPDLFEWVFTGEKNHKVWMLTELGFDAARRMTKETL